MDVKAETREKYSIGYEDKDDDDSESIPHSNCKSSEWLEKEMKAELFHLERKLDNKYVSNITYYGKLSELGELKVFDKTKKDMNYNIKDNRERIESLAKSETEMSFQI